jgi:sigma-B regulation protein RsbU (phosphoserine phosphatase)
MVNLAAAAALLAALAILTLRFRSYLAGRKLEQEVEIASSVQRDLLPSSKCKLEGFEIAGDYMPMAPVGGDFYDTFAADGDRAAFVLGDVSGKGIPAALLMGVLHGAVRSSRWTQSPRDHRDATREINRLLCQRASTTRFATMFWSYFDPASQHLKYINAGHCPPLLLKRDHQDATLHLSAGGPVLGVLGDAEFQQGSVRLDAGDVLVLYSDGIVEAANEAEEEFGEDRVLAAVKAYAGDSAEEIRNQVLAAVDAFAGTAARQDDRTLVVAVYVGAERRSESATDRPVDEFAAYAA